MDFKIPDYISVRSSSPEAARRFVGAPENCKVTGGKEKIGETSIYYVYPDVPTPFKREDRISFGVAYFRSEEDATKYDAYVKKQGLTYNGGLFHGMACGRNRSFDYIEDGQKICAVTD